MKITRFVTSAILSCGLLLLTNQPGQGAAVLTYDIASAVSPSFVPVASVAAGVSATSITKGVGIGLAPLYTSTQGFFGGVNFDSGTTRIADDYFQFSVQPTAGNQITYGTLTYGLFREIRSTGSLTGPSSWDLVYSLDGFSTAGTNITTVTVPDSGANNTLSQASFTTNISSIGTQTGTVTFRVYGYGAQRLNLAAVYAGGFGNASGSGVGRDSDRSWVGTGSNVILDGTVSAVSAVPEPSSLVSALIALSLMGGLACARRWQRVGN